MERVECLKHGTTCLVCGDDARRQLAESQSEVERLKAEQGYDRHASLEAALKDTQRQLAESQSLSDSRLATANQLSALVGRYRGKLDEVTRERDSFRQQAEDAYSETLAMDRRRREAESALKEAEAKLKDKLAGVGYLCLIHNSESCPGCARDLKKAESETAALKAKLAKLAILGIEETLLSTGKAAEILGVSYSDLFEAHARVELVRQNAALRAKVEKYEKAMRYAAQICKVSGTKQYTPTVMAIVLNKALAADAEPEKIVKQEYRLLKTEPTVYHCEVCGDPFQGDNGCGCKKPDEEAEPLRECECGHTENDHEGSMDMKRAYCGGGLSESCSCRSWRPKKPDAEAGS